MSKLNPLDRKSSADANTIFDNYTASAAGVGLVDPANNVMFSQAAAFLSGLSAPDLAILQQNSSFLLSAFAASVSSTAKNHGAAATIGDASSAPPHLQASLVASFKALAEHPVSTTANAPTQGTTPAALFNNLQTSSVLTSSVPSDALYFQVPPPTPTNQTSPAAAPVSPTMAQEVAYISGVTGGGAAPISFQTWNGDGPDSSTDPTVATYNTTMSNASKWAPGGVTAAPSAPGTAGGLQYYYFDPAAGFTAAQETALAGGLSLWSAVANIQFAQTTNLSQASLDFTGTTSGGTYEGAGSVTPEAIGSPLLNNQGAGTYLTINTDPNNGGFNLGDFNDGGSGVGVILHEEGHFLGLGHSGPYNGNVMPATQQFSAYDSHQYTLMSYISADNPTGQYAASYPLGSNPNGFGDSTTWMPLDILAVQALYGVATNTPLSGGQTFGFNDNIVGALHPFFDFSTITTPVLTLYDTGTGNTLDLSGYNTLSTVDLNPGAFSSFNGETDNMGIAYNTAIDTFVGGTGGTNVTVNADADTITDTDTGNTVDFAKAFASYMVASMNGVVTTVTDIATGIVDTLKGVQSLMFTDQTVNICFLEGVMIATPTGEVAVEDLVVGGLVSTRVAGRTVSKPVIWIGTRRVELGANASEERYPVRVRANAFADGVPSRDLLVTAEHCLHVDGKLIPARMLVNGASIIVDLSITSFTFFHVELAQHAILIADGMEAESYLDTGNRGNFSNLPLTAIVPDFAVDPGHGNWSSAAAPLTVDRETVEPIWLMLADRADCLGIAVRRELITLTCQPKLRLLLDDGRTIAATYEHGACHKFCVPTGTRVIRLLSRSAIPARNIGPFVDDRRMLGVAVEKLVLWNGLVDTAIPAATIALDGWHAAEGHTRWTNGNATLELPVAGIDTCLDVYVVGTAPYARSLVA